MSWKIFVISFLKIQKVAVGQSSELVFMQKQPSKGFFKKSVVRNVPELTRKRLCQNSFTDKIKLCRCSTSLKKSRQCRFSSEFSKICKKNFFAEYDQAATSENLNYDAKTKAHVPIGARSISYQNWAVLVKFEHVSEAVVCGCSSKQVFLKIWQIPLENSSKTLGDNL